MNSLIYFLFCIVFLVLFTWSDQSPVFTLVINEESDGVAKRSTSGEKCGTITVKAQKLEVDEATIKTKKVEVEKVEQAEVSAEEIHVENVNESEAVVEEVNIDTIEKTETKIEESNVDNIEKTDVKVKEETPGLLSAVTGLLNI